jgi:hypothetical protein
LGYLLQTVVPARWIPYVSRSSGYRAISLVQGMMPDAASAGVPPLAVILNRADVQILKDAEIPREGIFIRRQPSVTRRADSTYARWTTRRIGVGRGESASQLASDSRSRASCGRTNGDRPNRIRIHRKRRRARVRSVVRMRPGG